VNSLFHLLSLILPFIMTRRRYIIISIGIISALLLVFSCNVKVAAIGTNGTSLEGLEPANIVEVRSDGTNPMTNYSATAGIWMRPMFDNGEYFMPVEKHIVLEYNVTTCRFPNGFVLAMKAYDVTNDPRLDISIIWQGTSLDALEHGDVTSENFSRNATYYDGIEEDSLILFIVNETMNGTIGFLVGPSSNCTDNNTARFPGIDGDLLYGTRPCLVPIQENAINMTDAEWEAFVASVDQKVLGNLVNLGSMDSLLGQFDFLRNILSEGLFSMFSMEQQFDDAMDYNASGEDMDFDLEMDLVIGAEFMPAMIFTLSGVTVVYIVFNGRKQMDMRGVRNG
ncbi:MAG: hypothetical protein ACFFCS_01730, partial [Candidatus Hodarchaeota archaeon]